MSHLPYRLLREERRSLAATVLPSQELVLKVPLEASEERIALFLQRKLPWIRKQRRYFAQFKPRREQRYVSGETFRYRGRSYKLLVRKTAEGERVSLQPGVLRVQSRQPRERSHTQELVGQWYRERAHAVLPERLDACFALFHGHAPPRLLIRKMTRRWGSYAKATHRVILNLDLIQAATRHVDYVVTHELCHMTHDKHDQAFYRQLESRLPQWKELKAGLELSLLG